MPPTHCARRGSASVRCARSSSRPSTRSRTSRSSCCSPSAAGACRPARSRRASSCRRWRCSRCSRSRCGSSASCSRRCRVRWSRSIASTVCSRPHRNRCRRIRTRCRADRSTSKPIALEYGYVAGTPVLQDCDVRIASGEVVALVGPTGCGKTTLCELLAGLDRPDRGVVRVGGVDLTEVTRDDLRTSVALVFQESFLFADTIANNITIGTEASDDVAAVGRRHRAGGPVRRFAARGVRHGDRRAGGDAVGRPAPAHRARTCADPPPAVPAARRRDLGRRRDRRSADPARAARRARHDDADRRPPGLDDRARRPCAVHAGRAHRRDRDAHRTARDATATTKPWCAPTSKRSRDGPHRRRTSTLHGAAHDVIADAAPAQARDEFTERVFAAFEDDDDAPAGAAAGALQVLRRGLAASPELRVGLKATIVFAIVAAHRQARDPDPDPGHPRPRRARFERLPRRVRAAHLPRRGRDHDRRALHQPDRLLPAGARRGAGAVQPARPRVRPHPPAEHGRTHDDAARRVRVARHERHRDAGPLRAVGDDLVAGERHAASSARSS